MSESKGVRVSVANRFSAVPFLPEISIFAIGMACFYLFPTNLGFLTEIVIMALFVLSLDLLLGYTGIATLGQAAMFGAGAYAAGLFAMHVHSDPLIGLLVAGIIGTTVALASGAFMMRTHGLSFIILTIAVAELLFAAANQAQSITGGDDGLYGYSVGPILGVFEFDFFGKTGFIYSLIILVLGFFVLRRLVSSPFGLAAEGLREDRERMRALGYPVYRHLLVIYAISGCIAGIAGGLSAQTVQVVGLQSLSFTHSAEALVMLILGGTGRLYGALAGATIFMIIHHLASALDPATWMLVIGLLLVTTVLVLPKGLLQLFDIISGRVRKVLGGRHE